LFGKSKFNSKHAPLFKTNSNTTFGYNSSLILDSVETLFEGIVLRSFSAALRMLY